MASLTDLLGANLLKKKDEPIDTATALNGKVVGLYFSANWCPPCRGFTPKLAETYNSYIEKGLNFEIVFVSSDKTQENFDEYFGGMPWLALPFDQRDKKSSLSSKYKVRGIPSLIILDQDGSVITSDGRNCVMEDQEGVEFPWRPKPLTELLGTEFKGKDSTQDRSSIEGKTLGIYFSAHWCPPCKGFTPKLVSVYNKLKERNENFEVIFVSSDRSEEEYNEYYGEMPWLAIPFGDKRKDKLSRHFGVNGIPQFSLVDAELNIISNNARSKVEDDPEGEKFPWLPEPVEDLSTTVECMGSDINEKPALIIFMEGSDDHQQDSVTDILTPIAQEYAVRGKETGDQELIFFTAKSDGRIVGQIRNLCELPPADDKPKMLVLDIPDDGGFYVSDVEEITESAVRDFASNYKSGERKQLKR